MLKHVFTVDVLVECKLERDVEIARNRSPQFFESAGQLRKNDAPQLKTDSIFAFPAVVLVGNDASHGKVILRWLVNRHHSFGFWLSLTQQGQLRNNEGVSSKSMPD